MESVPERVIRRAEVAPDSAAVGEVTYAELVRRARRYAAAVRPGEIVGLVFPRGPELVAAELGVWLAGAAFLPLDPALPPARIESALRSAQTSRVLPASYSCPDASPRAADGLAYVISTSGSTGEPKSVAVGHDNLANLIAWYVAEYGLTPADRVVFTTGPGFDASILDIWGTLAAGATLVPFPDEAVRDPDELLARLDAERITQGVLPTPVGEALLTLGRRPSTLRGLRLGGDVLRVWPDRDFPAAVVNAYGPSEATVLVTATGDLRSYARDGLPPIGRPAAGALLRVVDDDGRVVASPGVAGELWIGGPGVARGYLGDQPGFGPAPWGEPGRWYRSGDRAAWDDGGELHFLGRLDRQVKIRGHRIELAEIERALLALPGVRQAAVALHDGRLVAYVVGAAESVREQLAGVLPAAMVPGRVDVVPAIPLTVNGKIDRAALPTGEEPRDARERTVAEVWAAVLKTPVGRDTDFFAEGGDSLSGTRIVARLRDVHGYSTSLRTLLATPVLHEFAASLTASGAAPPIAVPETTTVPLSDAQRSLLAILEDGGADAEMLQLVHLRGPVVVAALRNAATTVAARHEALRSTIGPDAQLVHPPAPVDLPVVDVRSLDDVPNTAELRPFDVTRERPFRVALHRLGPDESVLAIVTHHLFFDGQSGPVLLHDLAAAYSGREVPPPVPYREYVAQEEARKTPAATAEHLAFWRGYLRGYPFRELPAERPRPESPTYDAAAVPFSLPKNASALLTAFTDEHRVTRFAVLVSVFALALAEVSGVDDLLVGVSVGQRSTVRLESVVGELTHTAPLRFDLRAPRSVAEVCLGVARDFPVVEEYSGIHYKALLPELRSDQGFGLRFSINAARETELRFDGLDATLLPVPGGERHSNRDVRLDVWDAGPSVRCVLTYRTELYRRETIERVANEIVRGLHALSGAVHGV
ncbi:AMP-binding protein [Cryptosporangium phraense]|uniref:AMP-binding protein n=1 Tax=Cryptosporangium phraense TaxID=2593070 RepID=A0A545ANU0_9ACTN|nr:AMP-binding protein [Cryptosporangium phraense]TQS42956.1 AMP-binding protein [Cryptosporangium phraense]